MNQNYRFFANYHLAAKEFSNGNMETYGRLMYVLNSYGIEGETLSDLSPVEKLFLTSVKASIDLSLTLSESARKKGANKGAEKGANKGAENDIDIDKEIEIEKEKDNDKDSVKIVNLSDISFFINENNLSVIPSSLKKIFSYMKENDLDFNYLNYVLSIVEKEKPEADQKLKTACFVNKSIEMADKYIKHIQSKTKQKKEIPEHPSICPDCGKKLSACKTMENAWICKPCNKFYELKKGKWIWGS